MKLEDLKSRDEIGLVLKSMGLNGTAAEIGVAFGEHAEQILQNSSLKLLYLVDPWNYVPNQSSVGYGDMIKDWEGCYKYCQEKMKRYPDRHTMLRMTSEQASRCIPDCSLDFVYIDANHMSPMTDQDLEYWYPKVKVGGIFGGHDYHEYQNEIYTCNVKTAVDKFFQRPPYELIVVPGEVPSWYMQVGKLK